MAPVKLTARQEEVRDLVKARPEKSVKEIAGLLETTEQAIYQQLSRLRSLGVLPPAEARAKAKARGKARGKRVKTSARNRSPVVRLPRASVTLPPSDASANGATVEDTVAGELEKVRTRIGEIKAEQESLAQESHALGEREQRLDAAQKALVA